MERKKIKSDLWIDTDIPAEINDYARGFASKVLYEDIIEAAEKHARKFKEEVLFESMLSDFLYVQPVRINPENANEETRTIHEELANMLDNGEFFTPLGIIILFDYPLGMKKLKKSENFNIDFSGILPEDDKPDIPISFFKIIERKEEVGDVHVKFAILGRLSSDRTERIAWIAGMAMFDKASASWKIERCWELGRGEQLF